MGDTELVIKISQTDYEAIKGGSVVDDMTISYIFEAIRNGVQITEGHGDLIDRNDIEYLKAIHDAKFGHISWSEAIKKIKYSAPTIVGADKQE